MEMEALASIAIDATPLKQPAWMTCPCGPCRRRRNRPKDRKTDQRKMAGLVGQLNKYPEWARRSGLPVLADMVALREVLDSVIDQAVDFCRSETWKASWAEIGDATGLSRQAAQQRWGAVGGGPQAGRPTELTAVTFTGHPQKTAQAAQYYRLHGKAEQAERLEAALTASGRCKCCGRRLTDPQSVNAGIGPECAAKQPKEGQ